MEIKDSTKNILRISLVALFVTSVLVMGASAQESKTNCPCMSCYHCCYQFNYTSGQWEFKCTPLEIPSMPDKPPSGCKSATSLMPGTDP
jgi:hypothetical protein